MPPKMCLNQSNHEDQIKSTKDAHIWLERCTRKD